MDSDAELMPCLPGIPEKGTLRNIPPSPINGSPATFVTFTFGSLFIQFLIRKVPWKRGCRARWFWITFNQFLIRKEP